MIARIGSIFANKWLRYGLIGLGSLTLAVLVFAAGFAAGRWSASSFGPFARVQQREFNFRSGHGAIGMIQTIDGQKITIQSRDGKLETILVNNDTKFDKNFQQISFSDLKLNDTIVVIGSPNDEGEINARLVGLVDPGTFRLPGKNFPQPTKSK